MKCTRISSFLVAVAAIAIPLSTQSQAELSQRLEAKLAKAWVKNAAWVTDFDAAKQQAKESGKQIFAYFTRSYAP